MDKKVSLEFAVDGFEFEDVKDARFAKGIIHAFADGANAHTHPIDTKVLVDCANSVYDIPLVCRYNGFTNDFMSHEPDETPIGFIKETSPTYSNPIVFEKSADGRTFLVIKALIWKKYAKDAIRVFKESDGKKAVSVEITITKGEEIDGKIRVDEFVLDGITVLGDWVNPAVKDARIQVQFAQDKEAFLQTFSFAENTTEETGEQKMSIEDKNMSNGTEVSCADNEVNNADNVNCADEPKQDEKVDEAEMYDGCGENADMSDGCTEGADMSEGCACNEDMADNEDADDDKKDDGEGDKSDDGESKEDEPEKKDEEDMADGDNKSEEMSVEAAMSKIENMSADMAKMSDRINELEAQNKAYMSQIESMSDYDSLKEFKFSTEQRMKQEADMATMNSVMADIASRGYNMSDDEKTELMAKFSEFSSADAWANYVKAQAFDKCENNSSVQQIGLPFAEPKKTNSIWDSL